MTLTRCFPFPHTDIDREVCRLQIPPWEDVNAKLRLQDAISEFYEGGAYRVMKLRVMDRAQLKVWRKDEKKLRNHWAVLQAVKNKLLPDWYGYECYPPEEETIDTANRYHIWCFFEPLFPTYSKELAQALKGKKDG